MINLVLSNLGLPNDIIKEILSYGYSHPLLDTIRNNVNTDPKTLFNKQKVRNEFILKINRNIRDQSDDYLFSLYYVNSEKLKYKVFTDWLYNKQNLKKINYLNLVIELLDTDFPKYGLDYSRFSPSSLKNNYPI